MPEDYLRVTHDLVRFAKKRNLMKGKSKKGRGLGLSFCLLASSLLGWLAGMAAPISVARANPPVGVTAGPTPTVRLGEEFVPHSSGTVEIPILVKNDYKADGLQVSIDYDEVFLAYAWYRTANPNWRVERVAPYGRSRITIILKRNNKIPPADPEADQPEVVALYARFLLQDNVPEDKPFRVRTPLLLGSDGEYGGLDSYFFTIALGEEQYRPTNTRVIPGAVTIYFRDGVELGSGSVTRTEQRFTLPLYLTYFGGTGGGAGIAQEGPDGQRVFTVGIDYDEIFLSLVGIHGVSPPLEDDEIAATEDPLKKHSAIFKLTLAAAAGPSACHEHVADFELTYSGLEPPDGMLVVKPVILLGRDPSPEGQAGDAPDGGGETEGGGGSGPGTEPGIVDFLPAYFVRGNADSSVMVNSKGALSTRGDQSDVILILESIFLGRTGLPCADAADLNDNGKVELSDAVLYLNHLFRSGPPPAAPYPQAGVDLGVNDDLDCQKPLPYFRPTGNRGR